MRGLLIAVLFSSATAHAYAVAPAESLDALVNKADLVCKGVVTGDAVVTDPWFDAQLGYTVHETTLTVASCLKGGAGAKTVRFRHYQYDPSPGTGVMFTPPNVELRRGRAYIVFAAAGTGGAFRTISKWPTARVDADAILAADAQPVRAGATVDAAVWTELTGLVASADPDDEIEGIRQLDLLSGGHMLALSDYPRATALAAIAPGLVAKDAKVIAAALDVFGEDSPSYDEDQAPFWLEGLGRGEIEGMGPRKVTSPAAAASAEAQLLALARDVGRPVALRAKAIRALGRLAAAPSLAGWAADKAPEIRAAATLASRDRKIIAAGLADRDPQVRASAALAVGFTADKALLPKLAALVSDPARAVHAHAALALLSFPVAEARAQLVAGLATDYRSLFVLALAKADPAPYLKQLEDVIVKHAVPVDWWGGSTPDGVAWRLVFRYAKQRPVAELAAGKHDAALDALEKMHWFSSSEPRDLYALYVARKLTARAAKFRAGFAGSALVDAHYFDEAAKNPDTYLNN